MHKKWLQFTVHREARNLMNVDAFRQNVKKRDQQLSDDIVNNVLYVSFLLVSSFSPSSLWTWYSATYSCLSIVFGIGRISVPNSCSILCSENLTTVAAVRLIHNSFLRLVFRLGWVNISTTNCCRFMAPKSCDFCVDLFISSVHHKHPREPHISSWTWVSWLPSFFVMHLFQKSIFGHEWLNDTGFIGRMPLLYAISVV